MRENEFNLFGNVYIAVEKAKSMSRCSYCAFIDSIYCLDYEIPQCDGSMRKDRRDVIFMEKRP